MNSVHMHTVPVGPVPAKPVPVQNLKYIEPGPTQ
jgi:hypothetical protein